MLHWKSMLFCAINHFCLFCWGFANSVQLLVIDWTFIISFSDMTMLIIAIWVCKWNTFKSSRLRDEDSELECKRNRISLGKMEQKKINWNRKLAPERRWWSRNWHKAQMRMCKSNEGENDCVCPICDQVCLVQHTHTHTTTHKDTKQTKKL